MIGLLSGKMTQPNKHKKWSFLKKIKNQAFPNWVLIMQTHFEEHLKTLFTKVTKTAGLFCKFIDSLPRLSVSFGTHILSDESSRVLQLSWHLS